MNDIKVSQKMKIKSFLSIEKNIIKLEKAEIFTLKRTDLEVSFEAKCQDVLKNQF